MGCRLLVLLLVGACSLARPTLATDDAASVGDSSIVDGSSLDADADADADAGGVRRRPLMVVSGKVVNGPHLDFPVLVSLSEPWLRSNANGGSVVRADAHDVYFTSDGTQRLSHELQGYDPLTGALIAWVKVPSLTSTTIIYLHYGDATITTSSQDVAGVWSGYRMVLHMEGGGDATGNVIMTSSTGGTRPGKIGSALRFDGATHYIDASSASAIDNVFATGGTAEGWINANGFGESGYGRVFDKTSWVFYVAAATPSTTFVFIHDSNSTTYGLWHAPAGSVSLGSWHHLAVTFSKSGGMPPALYLDGVSVGTTTAVSPSGAFDTDASSNLIIGNRAQGDRAFDGDLDELRLSAVARSAGWLATQYNNHSDPAGFFVVGSPI